MSLLESIDRAQLYYLVGTVIPVAKHSAIGAGGLGFDSRNDQSGHNDTTCHRCDISSQLLCCPGAKPQKWAPTIVTCFGPIPRVAYNDAMFFCGGHIDNSYFTGHVN